VGRILSGEVFAVQRVDLHRGKSDKRPGRNVPLRHNWEICFYRMVASVNWVVQSLVLSLQACESGIRATGTNVTCLALSLTASAYCDPML